MGEEGAVAELITHLVDFDDRQLPLDVLARCIEALCNLGQHPLNRSDLVTAGGVTQLVNVLETVQDVTALSFASECLSLVARDEAHREAIVTAGAVAPLVRWCTESHDTLLLAPHRKDAASDCA